MAATKMALGLNSSRDGLSICPFSYDAFDHVLGVNLEKYVYGLSEAGLSTRFGEPITIEHQYWGNSAGAGETATLIEGGANTLSTRKMDTIYLVCVHEAEVLLRTGSCVLTVVEVERWPARSASPSCCGPSPSR